MLECCLVVGWQEDALLMILYVLCRSRPSQAVVGCAVPWVSLALTCVADATAKTAGGWT